MPEKIKQATGIDHFTVVYLLVIIGVGICAFGLGRLSASNVQNTDAGMTIIPAQASEDKTLNKDNNPNLGANALDASTNKISGKYVASKNGKLYYPVGCKGANRIKEENKVWFDTPSMAEGLGYKPSPACK